MSFKMVVYILNNEVSSAGFQALVLGPVIRLT